MRRPHPHRRSAGPAALLGLVLLLGGAPTATAAGPAPYVALGDSFAAGVGTTPYPDDDVCGRSPASYPVLVARRSTLRLTFAACAGAVTADVVERQARSLRPGTRLVSLTVGGNDLGFTSVLTTCALPGWLGRCGPALDRGLTTLRTELPGRLDEVLRMVEDRAPRARVVVTGYPRLFNGDDCSVLTFFSRSEMRRLNAATDELNDTVRARALAAGARYVGPAPAFTDHAWCDDTAWVHGPSSPLTRSYHPTAAGHAALAALVGPALTGGPLSGAGAARAVRLPAGTARAGGHRFRAPDLDSPAVARAARAAGVTRGELERLRRAQRTGTSNADLDRLDATITRRAAARDGTR